MCGIAGIYAHSRSAPAVNQVELLRIRDRMRSRGPNGEGLWLDPDQRVGLAHRRLAIIDLSPRGAQPMVRQPGDLIVTFNGEIYNFEALRAQLIAAGYSFQSHCDTEVLLHLYDQKGAGMLADLRGMYAFAIWDTRKHELFLARDTYGIKPLYYSEEAGTFRFASSVKALLVGGAISHEPDLAGQAGFYLFGSVPEPYTTYRSISSLPAGNWMKVDARGPTDPVVFDSIAKIYADAEREAEDVPAEDLEQRARAALLDSVRHHMVADVPVGAFLSAGVDSGALVGLMRDAGAQDIQTLTLSFKEFEGREENEAPLAAEVARLYGTQHSTRVVTADEFNDDLPKILEAMDQPTIDGVNSWFVSKAVSEMGLKVALSGLGGDELLGGYPSFTDIPHWRKRMSTVSRVPGLGVGLREVGRRLLSRAAVSPKAFGIVEYGGNTEGAYLLRRGLFMPWELGEMMGKEAARAGLRRLKPLAHIRAQLGPAVADDFSQVGTLESSLYMRNQLLRDVDWASMAHSLEVRVPLVDVSLLKVVAPAMLRLGKGSGKGLLANAPSTPLPSRVVDRAKTGFGTPIGRWLNLSVRRWDDLAYGHSRAWARTIASPISSDAAALKSVKVLALVTDAFGGYGGIAQYNRDFLTAVAQSSEVRYVNILPRLAPKQANAPAKIKQYRPILNPLAYSLRALHLCLRYRPDVIFNGHVYHGQLARRLALLVNAKLISQLHGTEVWRPLKKAHLQPLASSDLVLCVSRDTEARYYEQRPFPPRNANVLHNTVDARFVVGDRRNARAAFGLTKEFIILTVARLGARDGYKGIDKVIKALPGFLVEHPNILYLVAGEGEDQIRLQALARNLKVSERVRFLGYVPNCDLPDLYRAADLFALPSTGEGFGIVFLEAMACGTPAIGLAVGGASDALFIPGMGEAVAPEAFARGLVRMIRQAKDMAGADRENLSSNVLAQFGSGEFTRNVERVLASI